MKLKSFTSLSLALLLGQVCMAESPKVNGQAAKPISLSKSPNESSKSTKKEKFKKIFNGKDLKGWERFGGAHNFEVKKGMVIGTTQYGPVNGFMTTKKKYRDFDLRFEVKCDVELNSGVQIRSYSRTPRGYLIGPQVEIEERDAGFVWGEHLGGWISKDRSGEEKQKAFKAGKWNRYRILAVGPRIQTWINGVQIADVLSPENDKAGRIGLQVHQINNNKDFEGAQVRWRNIRLKNIKRPKFTVLSKGKNLKDFQSEGNWQLEKNGVISLTPRSADDKGWTRWSSYLWLKKQYADFVVDFEYKHDKGGNSGFFFRCSQQENAFSNGHEIQILDSHGKKNVNHHDCGGLITVSPAKVNMAKPAGQWNHYRISCIGNHLQVHLNGVKIQDLQLDKTKLKDRPKKGFLGIQEHGYKLWLRNFKVLEIK